jgi:hypothetical protein
MSKPTTNVESFKVDLQALMQKWQKVLRLQDWEIDIQFIEPMLIGGSLGETHPSIVTKSAKIFVARPDMSYTRAMPFEKIINDIENTVVHELLHIIFTTVTADNKYAEEHAVIAIADALHRGIDWTRDDDKLKRQNSCGS